MILVIILWLLGAGVSFYFSPIFGVVYILGSAAVVMR